MTNISTDYTNFSFSFSREAISTEKAVSFWLGEVVIFILAVPGIMGNVLAFVVWHLQKTFNATAFLFKYLAVWDTAYLLLVMLFISFKCRVTRGHVECSVLYHTGNLVQLVSVNVTLLIAISRWIAVVFPLRASRLLTSVRIYVSCVVILVYCGALEVAQGIFDKYYPREFRVFVAKRVVGLALPLLLLLIFNLSLLWANKRASRQRLNSLQETEMRDGVPLKKDKSNDERRCASQSSQSAATSAQETPPETVALGAKIVTPKAQNIDEDQQSPHQQQQQHQRQGQVQDKTGQRSNMNSRVHHSQPKKSQQPKRHHMVTAVLLVSLCCFVAYPVGNSLQTYVLFNQHHSLLTTVVINNVAYIFQVLNSGLNVLIYWFFVSSFRQLAAKLRNRLCDRLHCGPKTDCPRQGFQ